MAAKLVLNIRILAVGTELTDGQVLEKNAAWLAALVTEMGYRVVEHRTVADDPLAIESALGEFLTNSDGIIVTGGLGPTSDDLTRQCVASALARELVWHEPSWATIESRFLQRGLPVSENQKTQAYYPAGAEVLPNSAGTANGFWFKDLGATRFLVVLPGPPIEVAAIWDGGLADELKALAPIVEDRKLVRFKVLGRGEGAVATQVEKMLDELAEESGLSRILVGYRASVPYVEIKFWLSQETAVLERKLHERVGNVFADILIGAGDFDFCDKVLVFVSSRRAVLVSDCITEGLILERLKMRFYALQRRHGAKAARPLFAQLIYQCGGPSTETRTETSAAAVCRLELAKGQEFDMRVAVILDGRESAREFKIPGRVRSNSSAFTFSERERRWATELALKFWSENV